MSNVHLVVEKGPESGRAITLTVESARLGRSSQNDIVLADPSLSRFHCRLSFRRGDGLWITDLGSSNQTQVNNKPVNEDRLRVGDRITMGDSELKVVSDQPIAAADGDLFGRQGDQAPTPAGAPPAGATRPDWRRAFLWGVAGLIVLVMLAVAIFLNPDTPADPAPPAPPPESVTPATTLEVRYEKVEATLDNIFRYLLIIDASGVLSIEIDDIENNRHIRKETDLSDTLLRTLAESITEAGFFELKPRYVGEQPIDLDEWDLSITAGTRTHRTLVRNRLQPERFEEVREMLEEFGKNELGLAPVSLPTPQLIALARAAFLKAQSLSKARDAQYVNLWEAIKSFGEAEWYLEAVEPKPDFYAEAVSQRRNAERELDERYEQHMFLADKAVHNREWPIAASELQIIRQLIPNRSEKRYQAADKMLLDVERRLQEN